MKMKMRKLCVGFLVILCTMLFAVLAGCKDTPKEDLVDNRTLNVSKTELTLTRGETETLTAALSVGKGEFTWTSSNEAVVRVSNRGEVYGVEVGAATVTVSYGQFSATCAVTVVLPEYVPVFEEEGQSISLWKGKSYPINGKVTFGGEEVAAGVIYQSADESVATVDENGVVYAQGAGETAITVTADYFGLIEQMRVAVTVTEAIIIRENMQTVNLDPLTDEAAGFKKTETLTVDVLDGGENITDTLTFAWTVVDPAIATLEENVTGGSITLTANSLGNTQVKASFTLNEQYYETVFEVNVNRAMYEIESAVAEDYSGNIVIALPDNVTIEKTPQSVTFGENATVVVSAENNRVTVQKSKFNYSSYAVGISLGDYGYAVNEVTYCTKLLKNSDAADFKALLTAHSNGYFILGEDLDFGGAQIAGAIHFSGTLDGKGYALKNFEIHHNAGAAEGWVSHFIEKNTGTVKNLAIEYVLGSANSSENAFIKHNEGTIENVFVDVTIMATGWNTSPLSGSNKGVIKNCVTVMRKGSDAVSLARIGGIISTDYNGTLQNCYVIHNGMLDGAEDRMYVETWGGGTMENCVSYKTESDMTAAVKAFPAENGWSEYWGIADGLITFDGKNK